MIRPTTRSRAATGPSLRGRGQLFQKARGSARCGTAVTAGQRSPPDRVPVAKRALPVAVCPEPARVAADLAYREGLRGKLIEQVLVRPFVRLEVDAKRAVRPSAAACAHGPRLGSRRSIATTAAATFLAVISPMFAQLATAAPGPDASDTPTP